MRNVELIKGIYEAFGRGDVPTVLGAMAPEIHWHEAEGNPYMPSGEAWIGPNAVLNNLLVRLATEWDGFTVRPNNFHEAEDSVVVEARYAGKHKATGRSLDAQVCHVFDIRGGKVTRFQQFVDTAQLQHVMGSRVGS
jgi:ketosteroid isomerase-like protein